MYIKGGIFMIDIDILQKQNNLTIIDGKVCIIPLSKRDFTTYPINKTDSYIKVSPEDYLYLKAGYLCFTDDFTALEIAPVRPEIAEEIPDEASLNGDTE